VTLVNRIVDACPCNVIDMLRRVRNRLTIIIISQAQHSRGVSGFLGAGSFVTSNNRYNTIRGDVLKHSQKLT